MAEPEPYLQGAPPARCVGLHPHAIARTEDDGAKVWFCTVCEHVIRPFHPPFP